MIKFAGNGATNGSMNTMSNRKYDTAYKLTANAFKRKGYTFNGWNTKKNAVTFLSVESGTADIAKKNFL